MKQAGAKSKIKHIKLTHTEKKQRFSCATSLHHCITSKFFDIVKVLPKAYLMPSKKKKGHPAGVQAGESKIVKIEWSKEARAYQ